MKAFLKWSIVRALALLLAASAAFAQDRVPFRQEELDQMLAPVALYPDSLLSQMLMASTYPLEVVQAARWSRANPGLKGQDAVQAVERMDWDSSVKSLTAFPQVLSMMDEKLEWTERLGEAFLAQQTDVMDTIQGLRRRADAAGNLGTDDRLRVARQGDVIAIEPPAPGVVYVPYYSPLVVYGPWWWPHYPPVFWAPPPHYAFVAHRPVFAWGSGIVISAGFFFGHFDWPHRHVQVVHVHHHHAVARPVHVHSQWRHDPAHRRGVPFRHAGGYPRLDQARFGSGTHRNDAAPAARPSTDRTAETRQHRWDERSKAASERRAPAQANSGPDTRASVPAAGQNSDRVVRPASPAGTRAAPAERNFQPGRVALPANDRRLENRDAPRPQTRRDESRPVVVPFVRSDPRPAAAPPAVRVESRPAVQPQPRAEARAIGRPVQAAPQQQRPVARETPAVARTAVGAPHPAPRAESHQRGPQQARGNGAHERRPPAGRNDGRKS